MCLGRATSNRQNQNAAKPNSPQSPPRRKSAPSFLYRQGRPCLGVWAVMLGGAGAEITSQWRHNFRLQGNCNFQFPFTFRAEAQSAPLQNRRHRLWERSHSLPLLATCPLQLQVDSHWASSKLALRKMQLGDLQGSLSAQKACLSTDCLAMGQIRKHIKTSFVSK